MNKLPQVSLKNSSDCVSFLDGAKQLCAGVRNGGKELCIVDGGGPLMAITGGEDGEVTWSVFGIESFATTPCGVERAPRVYTKVGSYLQWIIAKIG